MKTFAEPDLFRGGIGIPLILEYPQLVAEPEKTLPDLDDHILFFQAFIDKRGKEMRHDRSRAAKKRVPRISGRFFQNAGFN